MKLFASVLTALIIASATAAQGQSVAPKRFSAKLQGTTVLRDVEDKYNAQVYNREMPEVDGKDEAEALKAIKAQSAKQYPYKRETLQKKTTAAMPRLGSNFVTDSLGGIPSDNYMAINRNGKAVSVINQNISIHDAATGSFLLRRGLKAFSAAVGLNSFTADYRFDPKVMYDPDADRFICVMLNSTNARNFIVLGFSATADPSGAWNFYRFYGDYSADTTWFDYPAISMTKKEFFLTGNKIKYDESWQAGFRRTVIYQVNKQQGYNGDTSLTYQIWDSITYGGRNIRCLHPVKPATGITGPEQYFLSNRNFDVANDSIFLVKLSDTIGGSPVLSVTALRSALSYGVPPDGRQPDTSVTLATNDGRVLGAYINNDQIQFVSNSVHAGTGVAGIYHGTINNVSGAPTVTGNVIYVDSLDFGYPNISYATSGGAGNKSIISFNYSGPRTYPGLAAVYFDGSSYSPLLNVKRGDSSIKLLTGKQQRWGDYSGSQPEWGAPGVVWIEGIYGRANKSYGNYLAQIIAPDFTSTPVIAQVESKAVLYPNPAFAFINIEFEVKHEDVMTFTIFDMNGKKVDELPKQYCHEGLNVLQFNTAPLPVGNYILTVSNAADRQSVHRFSRN